jgi:hypothetical protein
MPSSVFWHCWGFYTVMLPCSVSLTLVNSVFFTFFIFAALIYATVLEETQSDGGAGTVHRTWKCNNFNTDDDERDVETCLSQQRYVMAVGLYTTENYNMPQKTNYKIKAKLLLTVGHNMSTYTVTQHVFFYRHYIWNVVLLQYQRTLSWTTLDHSSKHNRHLQTY